MWAATILPPETVSVPLKCCTAPVQLSVAASVKLTWSPDVPCSVSCWPPVQENPATNCW